MVRADPDPGDESPPLQAILDALDDADCRAILRETTEPMTATQLSDACDIPTSTLYRKLELLGEAGLVRERVSINPGGGRTSRYERDFDGVTVSMDDGEFAVSVDRPPRRAEERLADIWSKMGDEL